MGRRAKFDEGADSSTLAPGASRRIAAEAIGTALPLATVVGSGIMAQRLAGGNVALALLGNTLPTGAILVVLIPDLRARFGGAFQSGGLARLWARAAR